MNILQNSVLRLETLAAMSQVALFARSERRRRGRRQRQFQVEFVRFLTAVLLITYRQKPSLISEMHHPLSTHPAPSHARDGIKCATSLARHPFKPASWLRPETCVSDVM